MADNLIFKISLPGIDVQDASPEECSVHSGYDTMKLKLDNANPHFGRVDVKFNNNPKAGTYPVLIIDHGYDYMPFFYFFYSIKDSTKAVSADFGNYFANDAFGDLAFRATPKDKRIEFNLEVSAAFEANAAAGFTTVIGNLYSFRYYVFANDGIT